MSLTSESSNQTHMGNAFLMELLDSIGDGGLQALTP